MIYTNWGNKITILDYYPETTTVRIRIEGSDLIIDKHIAELKADNGLDEIEQAIKSL